MLCLTRMAGRTLTATVVLQFHRERIAEKIVMKRIIVYRNKDCEKCRRFARVHDFFDWLNQVEGSTATPPGGPLAMGEIAVEVIETGEILKGVEAVRCICRHTPAYLPFLLLLRIPAIARAVNRDTRGCAGESCAGPPPRGHHA